jgi:hypothetical protein
LYQEGQRTQSISGAQTCSGVAAISIVFWAKTIDDEGECPGGQVIRESGI